MTVFTGNKKTLTTAIALLSVAVSLFLLSACAQLGLNGTDEGMESTESSYQPAPENQPYFPTEFKDLLIPNELTWDREKSMVIKTDSFAGGILHFSGRVEINSVADFFSTSMVKSNWRQTGSVKYKNIMLVFTKPHKTCTIVITESEFGTKTEVDIYITDDLTYNMSSNSSAIGSY